MSTERGARAGVQAIAFTAAASLAALLGGIANFATLPRTCATTLPDLVLAVPEHPVSVLVALIIWLGSLAIIAIALRLAAAVEPARSWWWAFAWVLVVFGWGCLGASGPYYVLASPIPDFQCAGDPLWVATALGGAVLLVAGLGLALVVRLSGSLGTARAGR
jgi:hypothetical protein